MSKKIRTKKRNPRKMYDYTVKKALANSVVTYVGSHEKNNVCFYDIQRGEAVGVGPYTEDLLINQKHFWRVTYGVILRTDLGEEYISTEALTVTNRPVYQHEISEMLTEKHTDLIASTNPNHRVNVVWFASPLGREIADQEFADIATKLGAWNFPTQLEAVAQAAIA